MWWINVSLWYGEAKTDWSNKLGCYITLGWKGLPGFNTLGYWALCKLRKWKCCESDSKTLDMRLICNYIEGDSTSSINIHFQETFSTLMKVASLKIAWHFPPLLIRRLGLCTQTIQFGILITFVYPFHFNHLCKQLYWLCALLLYLL